MAKPPAPSTISLLTYLLDLERRRGGYELRGVRGWSTVAKAEKATGVYMAGPALDRAFRRGDLMREDISVPDAPHPLWIYRITDRTARKLAELEGAEHVPVQPCGVPTGQMAVLPPEVVAALEALRYASNCRPGRRARIEGEPEWRTARELHAWMQDEGERTGHGLWFTSEHVVWAVKRGLAERRVLPPPVNSSTTRPVHVYRITVAGAAIRPLIWNEPADE